MADTIKEIFSGTLTVADIASTGAVTLASTDANTQYVIKDVSVTGLFNPNDKPTLTINNFKVADVGISATGSEIMDINSTFKYCAYTSAPTLTANTFKLVSGQSGGFTLQSGTNYLLNGVNSKTISSAPVAVSSGFASNVSEFSQSSNGSIFYVQWDGNSVTNLFKRNGSINGTEETVVSLSYGWIVFDGVDSYYQGRMDNTVLYKYNINTGSTSSINIGTYLATTSYPSAYYMNNGKILVNPSGNSDTASFYVVDPSAGTYTRVTGLDAVGVAGTQYRISGYYNSTTNRYTFYKRYGATLYKATLNGALTIGSSYSGGVINTQYTIGSIGNANNNHNVGYVTVDSDNYTVAAHNVAGKTDLVTYNTATQIPTTVSWLPFFTISNTIITNTSSAAVPSDFTNSVKLRVTGVKSTI